MDLFKPKTLTGEWFPFGDGEILVRLIPADVDAGFHKAHFKAATREGLEKKGGENLSYVTMQNYLLDRAAYALVESRNLWAPHSMIAEALTKTVAEAGAVQPESREDGMVRLDGFWSDVVKRTLLKELLEKDLLGYYILACSKKLAGKVDLEREELGKA